MFRLAILLICLSLLPGCRLVLEALESLLRSPYEVFSSIPFDQLSPEEQEYWRQLGEGRFEFSENPLYRYSGGELDITNDQLDMWVLAVPAPDMRFVSWKEGPGYLFPGSTDTLVNLKTKGLSGPDWRNYFLNSDDILTLGATFKERSSADMSRESSEICMPFEYYTPGSRVTTTNSYQTGGRDLTIRSTTWASSFKKVGAYGARIELRGINRIQDEGNNLLATERSTQRVGVTWPNAGGEDAGVKLYYERIDTETVGGEKQVSVAVFPTGLTTYPGSLDLLNRIHSRSGGGRIYQGSVAPSSPADFSNVTWSRKFSHNRVRKSKILSVNGGPIIDAYTCGINIEERITLVGQGQFIDRNLEEYYLATDSLSHLKFSNFSASGGFEDRTTAKSFNYETEADGRKSPYTLRLSSYF